MIKLDCVLGGIGVTTNLTHPMFLSTNVKVEQTVDDGTRRKEYKRYFKIKVAIRRNI